MNAKTALAKHLLSGKTINIKTCFTLIGLTNAPRECSRMIEKPFGVKLHRDKREGKSRYGQDVVWIDYSLPFTEENIEGIKKMTEYIAANGGAEKTGFKTDNERREANRKESYPKQTNTLFDIK